MALHCLSSKTATLLKSSQIITSVSTVVKELMENAIDAGANNIEIKLEYHGMGKIEVKDDGYGIKRDDTPYMCLPSYTSKIKEFSDLEELHSYGFRGEALNAICRLADVTVTTRTDSDEYAMAYTMDAKGEVKSQQPSHVPKGTIVSVGGLFRSLPVRREFMRNQQRVGEELRKAEAVVKALAAVHPQLRATLSHNKCVVWQKSAVATVRQSLLQVVGHQLVGRLEEHCLQHPQFTTMLMLPKKSLTSIAEVCQSSADCMMLYVNKRPVRHRKIEKLVVRHVAGFYPQFPSGKHPTCFISIEVPPADVDVNVEPNKTRVFLKDEDVLLAKLDEFLNFHYEPKLPKPQTTKDQKAVPCEKNEDCLPSSQGERLPKRPKLDAAKPGKCSQLAPQKSVRAAYKLLQVESSAAALRMQQCADPDRAQQIVEECQNAWAGLTSSDDQVAKPVTSASLQASTGEFDSISNGTLYVGHLKQELNDSQTIAFCGILPSADRVVERMDVGDEQTLGKSPNDRQQQSSTSSQDDSNSQKDSNDVSGSDECVSQFFLDIDAPVRDLKTNDMRENPVSKVTEHNSSGHLGTSVFDIVQGRETAGGGASEEVVSSHRGGGTEQLPAATFEHVIPEQVDTSLWDLMDCVSNSALEGSNATCSDSKTREGCEIKAEALPSGQGVAAEKSNSFRGSEACQSCEGSQGSGDVDVCRVVSQSLWDAADAAAGFTGSVVAAEGSPVDGGVPDKEPASRSPCWNADVVRAEKWSRGNVVTKKGRALQGGAMLLCSGGGLNDTVQSASSQMGCKEQSAFTKFSRYMRPRILDENPGIAFTKVAGLLVSRWRELPLEEQARYADIAAQAQQQRHAVQERHSVAVPRDKKTAKKEVPQPANALDGTVRRVLPQLAATKREYAKIEVLPFTLDDVRVQFSLGSANRARDGPRRGEELCLVGQSKPSGSWLYVRGQELGLLRHKGLQEKVLHHKLMAEHVIPTRQLEEKLAVSQSSLGSELWELLLSLDRKYCAQTRSVLLSCPALDRNGFKVDVIESGAQATCFLTSVASVTRFCGVADLQETLRLVQFHGTELAQLQYCRPLKIANYLRCEAVRMTQQSPGTMDRDSLLELLRFWDFHMAREQPTCLHHKPIYVPIHQLDSIPVQL